MRVIPPLSLTDAMITSSTAAEPGIGEAAWASGTTYALGQYAILGVPTATVTITNASPAVITWTAHSLPNGTPVAFTTTGTLPAGLTTNLVYYVIAALTDTFQVSAVIDGVPIVTTSGGSGTHTGNAYIHRVYESLQASNTGHHPLLAASSTWWIDVGPTNKWAMFDLSRNTQSSIASPLTVVITPGQRVNSIALLGLIANNYSITATSVSGGGSVYSASGALATRIVTDWYDYFFQTFTTLPNIIKFDIPPYSDIIITITLTTSTAGVNVQCGSCVLGTNINLGTTQYQAVSDVINFSTIDRDIFGNATLVPRRNVPKTVQKVFSNKTLIRKITALRDSLNASPAVWSGLDDITDDMADALLILGIYKTFSINLDQPTAAIIDLELEEI